MHSPWPRECNFHDVIYVIGTQNKHRVAHGKHLPWRIYTSLARKRLEIDLFCQLFGYPKANFGPLQGGSFTHFIIIMRLFIFDPKVHRKSSNKVSLKARLRTSVRFELGRFRFRVNALFQCATFRDQSIRFTLKTLVLDVNHWCKAKLWSKIIAIKPISTENSM